MDRRPALSYLFLQGWRTFTKPAGSGTRLGLSLSYDIVVTGHGGNLTGESQPGIGTTFTMELPSDER